MKPSPLTSLLFTEVSQENLNLAGVIGDIIENSLQEKDEHDWYNIDVKFTLPVTIGLWDPLLPDDNNTETNSNEPSTAETHDGLAEDGREIQGQSNTQLSSISNTWIGAILNTTLTYSDDNGYDFSASLASIGAPGIVIKDLIELYTETKMTWESGKEAKYKSKDDKTGKTSLDDPEGNNIGKGIIRPTKEQYEADPAKYNDKGFYPVDGKGYAGDIVGSDGYKPAWDEEGGSLSLWANERAGMNIMSVLHDKFSDYPILNSKGVLQITIIPAIAVTYFGLIGMEVQQNMTPLDWHSAEKLKGTGQTYMKDYIAEQKKKVEELQQTYFNK